MFRSLRIEFPGAIYHLTSRGNARQKIYRDNADRETFSITLSHVVDRYAWRCHAYLMERSPSETPNATSLVAYVNSREYTPSPTTVGTEKWGTYFKAVSNPFWELGSIVSFESGDTSTEME